MIPAASNCFVLFTVACSEQSPFHARRDGDGLASVSDFELKWRAATAPAPGSSAKRAPYLLYLGSSQVRLQRFSVLLLASECF